MNIVLLCRYMTTSLAILKTGLRLQNVKDNAQAMTRQAEQMIDITEISRCWQVLLICAGYK